MPFIVVAYDIPEKRSTVFRKICIRYLLKLQKSVFEGSISEKNLVLFAKEVHSSIKEGDFIKIYKINSRRFIKEIEIGKKPFQTENYISE